MKLQILFVFVLSVQLVFGTDTCSLTCEDAIENSLKLVQCEEYTFRVTSTKLPFDEAQGECFEMGGDLLQANFGPQGAKYHDEIYQLAIKYVEENKTSAGLWIGYTDRSREDTWRFLNGATYNATDLGQEAVAYWGEGEPNSSGGKDQDCGKLWRRYGPLELDDEECHFAYYGLCEIKTTKCISLNKSNSPSVQ